MKIYHVKGTRSVRVIWLCEELGLPYEVEIIDFSPAFRSTAAWRAKSPTGKVPVMEDDGFVMFESGAMVQYILDRYGNARLRPEPGTPSSARFLQWCWFAKQLLRGHSATSCTTPCSSPKRSASRPWWSMRAGGR